MLFSFQFQNGDVIEMIKYKSKKRSRGVFGGFVMIFIHLNNFILLKIFNVKGVVATRIVNFLNYVMYIFEITFLATFFKGWDVVAASSPILYPVLTFFFLWCSDELPYWEEPEEVEDDSWYE